MAKKFEIIPNYIPARSFDGNVLMVSMFLAIRKFVSLITLWHITIRLPLLTSMTFQVSGKQSELGIGQVAIQEDRFKIVDVLIRNSSKFNIDIRFKDDSQGWVSPFGCCGRYGGKRKNIIEMMTKGINPFNQAWITLFPLD